MRLNVRVVSEKFQKKFASNIPENENHYAASRNAFIVDGATAVTIAALITGTFLSGLLEVIGASKLLNGIISALPLLASLSSPFGAFFAQHRVKQKMFVCAGAFLHRLMFTTVLFLPIMPISQPLKVFMAAILICAAHCLGGIISPSASGWLISLVPAKMRGRYFATRELISLITLAAITLSGGSMLDFFDAKGKKEIGFVAIGIIVGLLTIVNVYALLTTMEPEAEKDDTSKISLLNAFKMVLKDDGFRPFIIMNGMFNFSAQILIPYFGIYLIHDLKISYIKISVVAFATSILKAVVVKRWGSLADRTSWTYVSRLAILIIAISHIMYFFMVPGNSSWLYPGAALFSNFGWAAIGIAIFNTQYDYAPKKGRSLYIGVGLALTGILGFLGAIAGSAIMTIMKNISWKVFNSVIKPQQIMSLFSGFALLVCVVYIKNIMETKEKQAD